MKTTKRIAVLASSRAFIESHHHLIRMLVSSGHEVFCIVPDETVKKDDFGAKFYYLPLQRTGFNPLSDLNFLCRLISLFRRLKPDMTIAYTLKPVIYASIAAKIVKVPFISSVITGLGYPFNKDSLRQKLAGFLAMNLCRIALAFNQKVLFLNPDDLEEFSRLRVVEPGKSAIINGSGVDLDYFSFTPLETKKPVFLLIARLLKEKGILEFIEAAKIVKDKYPEVSCKLLGPKDPGPSGISLSLIERYSKDGVVEYLGKTDDVRPYLREAGVYILPSYREGIPRTNLEAMATGRAIITTDAPGCRETVKENLNGFLVPPKNSVALAEAMMKFVEKPALMQTMGKASRQLAENKFEVNEVNQAMLKYLRLDESSEL